MNSTKKEVRGMFDFLGLGYQYEIYIYCSFYMYKVEDAVGECEEDPDVDSDGILQRIMEQVS